MIQSRKQSCKYITQITMYYIVMFLEMFKIYTCLRGHLQRNNLKRDQRQLTMNKTRSSAMQEESFSVAQLDLIKFK